MKPKCEITVCLVAKMYLLRAFVAKVDKAHVEGDTLDQ